MAWENETKRYRTGTHRAVPPEQTLARVRPLLGEMGITRIANITGLDRVGLPVVMVCRPNSRSVSVSQGKGLALVAAKASGVMEAIETYHAETITLPLRFGSRAELANSVALVGVDGLPRSQSHRYRDDLQLLWIEARDWLNNTSTWLPYEIVSTNYTLPCPRGSGCFAATTNGLASGNTLMEAVAHGIYEVVERDACTLWKLGGARARKSTGVDPDSIDDLACRAVLARFADAGIEVRIWQAETELGLPVFLCLAAGDGNDWADPEFGAGCHAAREIALVRALTEAAQARTTFIAGARDDIGADLYRHEARHRRREYCRELMDGHSPAREFADVPTFESESLAEDLDWCLARLRAAAIRQVLVVDLTKKHLGVPVVRVVIPGLEGPFEHEQGDYVPGTRARCMMGRGFYGMAGV